MIFEAKYGIIKSHFIEFQEENRRLFTAFLMERSLRRAHKKGAEMENSQLQIPKRSNPILGLFARLVIVTLAICLLFNLYVITINILKKTGNASAFGATPIVVVKGEEDVKDFVKPGELLFAFGKPMDKYAEGERVAFSRNGWIYIGEIVGTDTEEGTPVAFRVQAAFSEEEYRQKATESNLLGEISLRIPLLGYFVLFLSSMLGRIIFVGSPLFVYLILLFATEVRERKLESLPQPIPVPVREEKPGKPDPRYVPGTTFLWTSLLTVFAIYYGTHPKEERVKKKPKIKKKPARTPAQVTSVRISKGLAACAKRAASYAMTATREETASVPAPPVQGIYVGSIPMGRVRRSRAH